MVEYKAPLREYEFILREVLQIENELGSYPAYSEATWDMIEMISEQFGKISEDYWLKSSKDGDEIGVIFDEGKVIVPESMKEATRVVIEGGLTQLFGHQEYGGMEFPNVINVLSDEMSCATNMSLGIYLGLTKGAYHCIHKHGSKKIRNRYLPKFLSGEWFGTMCLTEAHCGTDLGLIRTSAKPNNSAYLVSGQKIFISCGEHDMADNIIHLVLARLPGAPKGVKGISLFLVPKYKVNEDGTLGGENGVNCVSIEEKMGIHGSATCVMSFEKSEGYLIGELNEGLAAP
jgi:butyryl-CoA dehydrogenase